jgi:putative aminopeptidase FrvX
MDIPTSLAALLRCHSTPGDEGEVAAYLAAQWRRCGLEVTNHGRFAVSARAPQTSRSAQRPVLLIGAHMDSPGFTVEEIDRKRNRLKIIRLGHPQPTAATTPALLKTRTATHSVNLRRRHAASKDGEDTFWVTGAPPDVALGDRLCYQPSVSVDGNDEITAPFLDNRLGCAILCELAATLRKSKSPFQVVLGATACEEMGGFGAPVLARAIEPDLVLCLDATYEAPKQEVRVGGGPVLTLSDASVLLSPAVRDQVRDWFRSQGLPLQTEVYNYSGTDARAFPHQGLPCPVLPLLLATRGNHTPRETGSLRDFHSLLTALERFATAPPDLQTPRNRPS